MNEWKKECLWFSNSLTQTVVQHFNPCSPSQGFSFTRLRPTSVQMRFPGYLHSCPTWLQVQGSPRHSSHLPSDWIICWNDSTNLEKYCIYYYSLLQRVKISSQMKRHLGSWRRSFCPLGVGGRSPRLDVLVNLEALRTPSLGDSNGHFVI